MVECLECWTFDMKLIACHSVSSDKLYFLRGWEFWGKGEEFPGTGEGSLRKRGGDLGVWVRDRELGEKTEGNFG